VTKITNDLLVTTVTGENLITNSNWQLFSELIGSLNSPTAIREDGTDVQTVVTVSSFNTTNGQPTFLTANTAELHPGSLVTFGAGLGGLSNYALRVIGVVPNTSFVCQIPYGNVSPSSSSVCTAFPCGISQLGGSSTCADGWVKDPSLRMWPDDFASNSCVGAKRVLGLRKGSADTEYLLWTCPPERINEFRGRKISLGALVYIKGGGSVSAIIDDNVIGRRQSASTSPVGYTDADYGHYEFITVNARISPTAASIVLGFAFSGAIGNRAYVALPTSKYGWGMTVDHLGQPRHEIIVAAAHWNPPSTVPFIKNFPASMGSIVGLFGWWGLDIEALSLGQAHNSLSKVNCKIEAQSPTVGLEIFIGAMEGEIVPSVRLTFGPQTHIQVANQIQATSATWLPLRRGPANYGSPPGCFVMFSGHSGGAVTQITFDFDDVMA
jgi:hypothetical protein